MAAGARRKKSGKREDENPYASLGRDKFSALLADIEEKKRTILSQIGPEEVSLIRFVSSEDNQLKPIVIRANNIKYSNNIRGCESHGQKEAGTIRKVKADEDQKPAAAEKELQAEGSKTKTKTQHHQHHHHHHQHHHQQSLKDDEGPKTLEIETNCEDGKKLMKMGELVGGPMKFPKLKIEPVCSSLKDVVVKVPRVEIQPTHIYVGVIAVMVLLFLALVERYWKVYYQLQFQTHICERMGAQH